MTWGWSARGPAPVDLGGSRGSVAESKTTKAWPNYEAEYLRQRLEVAEAEGIVNESDKYNATPLNGEAKAVYLNKITDHYKDEADECLQTEFKEWLQGYGVEHEGNMTCYQNTPGAPIRRYVYRSDLPNADTKPGDPMLDDTWCPTWWQGKSLAHLPGVREYLRSDTEKAWWNEYQMNLLAEHGPQNIEQAWMYFKHWVKKRPLTETWCYNNERQSVFQGERPAPGVLPHHFGRRPEIGPQPQPSGFQTPPPAATAPVPPAATAPGPPPATQGTKRSRNGGDGTTDGRPKVFAGGPGPDPPQPPPATQGTKRSRDGDDTTDGGAPKYFGGGPGPDPPQTWSDKRGIGDVDRTYLDSVEANAFEATRRNRGHWFNRRSEFKRQGDPLESGRYYGPLKFATVKDAGYPEQWRPGRDIGADIRSRINNPLFGNNDDDWGDVGDATGRDIGRGLGSRLNNNPLFGNADDWEDAVEEVFEQGAAPPQRERSRRVQAPTEDWFPPRQDWSSN